MNNFIKATIRNTEECIFINTNHIIKIDDNWINEEKSYKAKLTLVDEVIYVEEDLNYFNDCLGITE